MKPILCKRNSRVLSFGPSGLDLRLPKSAMGDLNKIRFDGANLVDISLLPQLYVTRSSAGIFELHARNIPGSQLVTMSYLDKDRLIYDNGTIRLKTQQEVIDEERAYNIRRLKSKLKYLADQRMGNVIEMFLFTHKLLYVFVKGFRTQNTQIINFIDDYLAEMDQFFDMADPDFRQGLIDDYQKFRGIIKDYLEELGDIGG